MSEAARTPDEELKARCFEFARGYWRQFPGTDHYYVLNVKILADSLAEFVRREIEAAKEQRG
jgi:hypothetical protein